jgi:RNA polymerase sigma-70 factor (ECF subfamily)
VITSAVPRIVADWDIGEARSEGRLEESRSDEDLFAAYVAGDALAFGRLVSRWTPTLRGILARGGAPPSEVDELVQEVFLRLHRSAADFRPGSQLRPWLLTIALNLKRESVRQRVRRSSLAPMDRDRDPETVAGRGASSDSRLDVEAALGRIPEAQRQVIELHWFAGLPFQDIAEAVGASVGAVKVRAHRGYEAMRALLLGGGDDR